VAGVAAWAAAATATILFYSFLYLLNVIKEYITEH